MATKRKGTLHCFYTRRLESLNVEEVQPGPESGSGSSHTDIVEQETHQAKFSRIESNEFDMSTLERDPGLRRPISECQHDLQDEIRRAYINFGPYQPKPPPNQTFKVTNKQRFVTAWYKLFPNWLEYSPIKDHAFCPPWGSDTGYSRAPLLE
ncbi:Zinc finger MYM-type protein [Heracleum sosnowskyi]|uniref:Zinc finger MYM-type protein n=1 Tax=Heracleum sosnowskyi TaxID=360622 RepID=A0AAD8JDL7_9APIA|nr:Zinc finger MYM-type protein [Heracleum sosnowskyi]